MRRAGWAAVVAVAVSALWPAAATAGGPSAVLVSSPEPDAPAGLRASGVGRADVASGGIRAEALRAARELALGRALGEAAREAAFVAPRLGVEVGATRRVEVLVDFGRGAFRDRTGAQAVSRSVLVDFAFPPAAGEVLIVATGRGTARVRPRDRRSNASIALAVTAARRAAVAGAIASAQREVAAAAGRAGYAVVGLRAAVSGAEGVAFAEFPPVGGEFGPGIYCGRQAATVRTADGPRRVVRRVCDVPRDTSASWTLTYAAVPAPAG